MIHIVRLSEGKELPPFQHFRSTKTSNKFLYAWGKIISAETLLDENMWVACSDFICDFGKLPFSSHLGKISHKNWENK